VVRLLLFEKPNLDSQRLPSLPSSFMRNLSNMPSKLYNILAPVALLRRVLTIHDTIVRKVALLVPS
jgi:hypothetical protein